MEAIIRLLQLLDNYKPKGRLGEVIWWLVFGVIAVMGLSVIIGFFWLLSRGTYISI